MYSLYTLCGHPLIAGTLQLICVFCIFLILAKKTSIHDDIVIYMEDHKIMSAGIFTLCLLISLFSNPNFYRFVGCEDIRTMPEGEYCYYVEVNSELNDRSYTLPARVKISKSEHISYHLSEVYFSNGGYLRASDEEFVIGEPFSFIDQDGNYWDCSFTNKRCGDAPFTEDSDVRAEYTVLLTFNVLMLILAYISLFREAKEDEAKYNKAIGLCGLEKTNDPAPVPKTDNEPHPVSIQRTPPPQKPSTPFVVDGRENSIGPILLFVLGGFILAFIVAAIVIAACK